MTVASFVAAQRTDHAVPHVISCRALGVSPSWFYKWRNRGPTPRQQRRATLDEAVQAFLRRLRRPLWVAAGARRSRRRRLAGVEEECRGVDGPPGTRRPADEDTAWLPDPSRQGRPTGP